MPCQQNITGPFLRHQFLGATVKSWTCSAGLNQEGTTVTIQLVEDTCPTYQGVVFNASNRVPELKTLTDSFVYPPVGTPVVFRYAMPDGAGGIDVDGGFEYAGFVRNWTESKDSNGNPVFNVQLGDAGFLLENLQVIMADNAENVPIQLNTLNAYGALQYTAAYLGSICTTPGNPGAISPAVNEKGMAYADLLEMLHLLCSNNNVQLPEVNNYNPGGRVFYSVKPFDTTPTSDVLASVVNEDEFLAFHLDLTDMPEMPSDYRVSGPTASVYDIISEACTDAGHDFYTELLPVRAAGQTELIIKIRTIDRTLNPVENAIPDFVNYKKGLYPDYQGGIISATSGLESRNEPTNYFLYGAPVRVPMVETSNFMIPFFGYDSNGLMNQVSVAGGLSVTLDTSKLNDSLNTAIGSTITISEAEIQAALSDFDSWQAVSHAANGNVKTYLDSINQLVRVDFVALGKGIQGIVPIIDIQKPSSSQSENDLKSLNANDASKVYEFIKSYCDEYYGKQFYVDASNQVCRSTIFSLSKGYQYDFDPSSEGCWTENATIGGDINNNSLDLQNNTATSDFFRDKDGKFQGILQYPVANGTSIDGSTSSLTPDPSKLDDGEYIKSGSNLFLKVEFSPQWLNGTPLSPGDSSAIGVVVKTKAPIVNHVGDSNYYEGFNGGALALSKAGESVPTNIRVGDRGMIVFGAIPQAIAPTKVMVPLKSNMAVYGPYYTTPDPNDPNDFEVLRGTILEQDEGLAPWEYGGNAFLLAVAEAKVTNAVTEMIQNERGSVNFAGIPEAPLNSELLIETNNDQRFTDRLFKNRTAFYNGVSAFVPTLAYLNYSMPKFDGSNGPIISNITANITPEGFTTQYQFNTYSPQFGKFAKLNADRLKRQGRNKLAFNRKLRALLQGDQLKLENKRYNNNFIARSDRTPKSAHHVLMQRYVNQGNSNRIESNSQAIKEINVLFSDSTHYQDVAMMSWDGIFRPVSKAGDGGLPRYINISSETPCDIPTPDRSKLIDPPTIDDREPVSPTVYLESLDINKDYLDPLANTSDSLITDDRSNSSTSGHNMEVLGRGANIPDPADGWSVQKNNSTASDYRFLAMRGPIMLQQWGYDLQGKPVPNAADVEADTEAGTFVKQYLQDKFATNWLSKPKTWPVAPIDLRLDRDRGVWTIPIPRDIIHLKSTEDKCVGENGCISGVFENAGDIYYDNGTAQSASNKKIEACWPWTTHAMPSGKVDDKMPVYWDQNDCKYYIMPWNRLDVSYATRSCDGEYGEPTELKDIKKINFRGCEGIKISGSVTDECLKTLDVTLASSNPRVFGPSNDFGYVSRINFTGCFLEVTTSGDPSPDQEDDCCSSAINVNVKGMTVEGSYGCGTTPTDVSAPNVTLLEFIGPDVVSGEPTNGCSTVTVNTSISGYTTTVCEQNKNCEDTDAVDGFQFRNIVGGYGIEIESFPQCSQGEEPTCVLGISSPQVVNIGTKLPGGRMVANLNPVSDVCVTGDVNRGGGVGETWADGNGGRYVTRSPACHFSDLVAGAGIGMTRADEHGGPDCTAIIFNNFTVCGSTRGECSLKKGVQISHMQFDSPFTADTHPGTQSDCTTANANQSAGIDGSDYSVCSYIGLDDAGDTWKFSAVTGLCVIKVDILDHDGVTVHRVVQDIDAKCGSLEGGSTTCGVDGPGNKKFYWIQHDPGNRSCVGGKNESIILEC